MTTVGQKLTMAKYRPAGFDYLRLLLAAGVVFMHFFSCNFGDATTAEIFNGWLRPFWAFILPMFFSLSGFLVAGSFYRTESLIVFLGLRAIRIIPALAVEITLSAFILGPLLTTVPLGDYFASHKFFSYFLNILGDIHYLLPGVFLHNPHPNVVNEQLWTIPWELKCYMAIALTALLRLSNKKYLFTVLAILMNAVCFAHAMLHHPGAQLTVHGIVLVQAFIAGVILYLHKDKILFSRWIILAAACASVLFLRIHGCDSLSVFPLAYVTVYLGVLNPRRLMLMLSGDYSYGIYLYSFPIQQAVASHPYLRNWLASLCIVVPCACFVAYLSWWNIEKPALGLKTRLPFIDTKLRNFIPKRARFGAAADP